MEKHVTLGEAILDQETLRLFLKGFRRLADAVRVEGMPLPIEELQRAAVFTWFANPVARRLLSLIAETTIQFGYTVKVNEASNVERAQAIIEDEWENPIHPWGRRQAFYYTQLLLLGELFLRPEKRGDVISWFFIPATSIKEVRFDTLHNPKTVVLSDDTELEIMHWEGDKLVGEVFYFNVNSMPGFVDRGVTEYMWLAEPCYDTIRLYKRMNDRMDLCNRILWDVTLEGADDDTIEKYKKEHASPPKPNTVEVHNEKVSWKIIQPSFGTSEFEKAIDLMLSFIAFLAGVPKHWLNAIMDVNRATASEMNQATELIFAYRQGFWRDIMYQIVNYILSAHGFEDFNYEIQVPRIGARVATYLAQALLQITNSLSIGQSMEWVTSEQAQTVFLGVLRNLGFDLTPEAEETEAQRIAKNIRIYQQVRELVEGR